MKTNARRNLWITDPLAYLIPASGGLTAMRELIRTLPNENILYFGDTGRVPYGARAGARSSANTQSKI